MIPLYQDPHFTFRFADDRIIHRYHLEGVEARLRVEVFKIDPGTGERMGLLAAAVGEGGWVDLREPITMRAGEAFIALRLTGVDVLESLRTGLLIAVALSLTPGRSRRFRHEFDQDRRFQLGGVVAVMSVYL